MNRTMLTLLAVALVALPAAAQERAKAEAKYDEGAVTISYGSPAWRAQFGEMMKNEETWRLGSNEPTGIKLTCGLVTDDGAIPAGEYKLAMAKNEGRWDLVLYEGDGFYDPKMHGWKIRPAVANDKADVSESLGIALDSKKMLRVRFGPHDVIYPFKPVRMHEPVETEFARIKTAVNVMAVPCEEEVDELACGSASISPRGSKVSWNMKLSISGETCTLHFKNARATAIAAEKEAAKKTIAMVKKRMIDADDEMKERGTNFIKQQEESIKKLEAEEAAMRRYKGEHTLTGKVSAREQPASTLDFKHERIEGGIILTFGAGEKTATFDVNPREFFNR